MSPPESGSEDQRPRGTTSEVPMSVLRPDISVVRSQPKGAVQGQFSAWRIQSETVENAGPHQEDDEDLENPGFLFIAHAEPGGLHPREMRDVRSHAMRDHVHKRKGKSKEEQPRPRPHNRPRIAPGNDEILGVGNMDPFNALPVSMSGENSRLLYYFAQHIAPLHYPHGGAETPRNPMTSIWIQTALKDPALLHSTLSSSGGHMLYYANLPDLAPVLLSGFLSHKAEAIRIINERVMVASSGCTDETLASISLLVTGQTCQGDYNEMSVHMHGLTQLVAMRGGLKNLGMGGLLAGEIKWSNNVTAFVTSTMPLLKDPDIENTDFESFEDPELTPRLVNQQAVVQSINSFLWHPAIYEILSKDLVAALRNLLTMSLFLDNTSSLSKHDMLVFERKRSSIQYQLANIAVSPAGLESYYINESCRIATLIYSIFILWGYKPPMNLYGDLAGKLLEALQVPDQEHRWEMWPEILLWTLFIGGYATVGRQERALFLKLIKIVLHKRHIDDWRSAKAILETTPVAQALWDPFKMIWTEAMIEVSGVEAIGDEDRAERTTKYDGK